ncbi:MAG: DNA polymerase/3'-5' exonuclease PolX [Herpetosiphon sp.]
MLSNQQVAATFRAIGDLMELLGEDRFKSQAYRRAAETISDMPHAVADFYQRSALEELPGIGKAIAAKIGQLMETGKIDLYERLKQQVPEGVVAVMHVTGVGPKRAMQLYKELGIVDVVGLHAAATAGRIRTLKGLGARLEATILQALDEPGEEADGMLLGDALALAHEVLQALIESDSTIEGGAVAGDARRGSAVVRELALVVWADDGHGVLSRLEHAAVVAAVEARAEGTALVRLHTGMRCNVVVAPPANRGCAWVLATGNAAHVARVSGAAGQRGLELRADGLWRGGERIPTADEPEVYVTIGMPWIAPELREEHGEWEAAVAGQLPALIELHDIQADLHMHTEWSDGGGTIAERAEACIARGYRYCAITDHGAYMGMVQGLDGKRLREQRAEIDAVNRQLEAAGIEFRVLQGCEVDILPDGELALPDEVLAQLDWVVASLHVGLKQDRATVTERLLRAIRSPHVDCIGHPTGRLLLKRRGADLEMEQILAAAKETGTVLEIDGAYQRLDLDSEVARQAIGMGIKIAIDSDAHRDSEMENMRFGVMTARRAWATSEDVINTWPWERVASLRKG